MQVPLTAVTKQQQGANISFDCPACGRANVPAETSESTEVAKVFFFIPVASFRNTIVKCKACRESFACLCPLSELKSKSKADLQQLIRYRASGWGAILSLVALLLCLVPLVNVILPGVAAYVNRGTRGWPQALANGSLTIGIAITGAFAILIICSHLGIIK